MIVIPMAGLSARFAASGYDLPKYMLPLDGRPLFDHCVGSFAAQFKSEPFLFVFRELNGTKNFVAERIAALGISTAFTISLEAPTRGQADTVAQGLRRARVNPQIPITIFNIDTIRPDFQRPEIADHPDSAGFIEVFEGDGDNWSFVRLDPENPQWIAETAEKRPISRFCSTGLYHFSHAEDFLDAVDAAFVDETLRGPQGEIYVAPLYNRLISQGKNIWFSLIERRQIMFAGVPAEYEALIASYKGQVGAKIENSPETHRPV